MGIWGVRGFIVFVLLSVLFCSVASSEIFINEVLPNGLLNPDSEWVELYNNGSSEVNLNNWNITETGASANITLNISIPAHGFVVLASNFTVFNASFPGLNASGRVVEYRTLLPSFNFASGGGSVFLFNASGIQVDNITYPSMGVGESFGRFPDASQTLTTLISPTPLDENDNARPSPSFITPSQGATLRGTINVTVTVSDLTSGVQTVRVKNGTGNFISMSLLGGNASNGNWTVAVDSLAISDGSLALLINATDAAGNHNASESISITIDNTAPLSPTALSPRNSSNLSGVVNFTLTVFDATSAIQSVKVKNGTSGSWIAASLLEGASARNYTLQIDTAALGDGAKSFAFNVTDIAGNENTAAFINVTIDNTAPSIALVSPSNNSNVSGMINITVTVTDEFTGVKNVSLVNVTGIIGMTRIQGNASRGNWSVLLSQNAIPGGNRTLRVNAQDYAGSLSSSFFITLYFPSIDP